MKTIKSLVAVLAVVFLIGCASQSRTVYNSLASVETATTGAYAGYLNLVVQGKLATNSVPTVSRDYNTFQATWTAAAMIAQWSTNTSTASQPVLDASTKVITDINVAKGQ